MMGLGFLKQLLANYESAVKSYVDLPFDKKANFPQNFEVILTGGFNKFKKSIVVLIEIHDLYDSKIPENLFNKKWKELEKNTDKILELISKQNLNFEKMKNKMEEIKGKIGENLVKIKEGKAIKEKEESIKELKNKIKELALKENKNQKKELEELEKLNKELEGEIKRIKIIKEVREKKLKKKKERKEKKEKGGKHKRIEK